MQHEHYEQRNGNRNLRGHKPAGRGRPKESQESKESVEACSYCGKKDEVIPILYGFPTHAGFMKADRGEVYLGGCKIAPYLFYCNRCDREF